MSIKRMRIRPGWKWYVKVLPLLVRAIAHLPLPRERKGIIAIRAIEWAMVPE